MQLIRKLPPKYINDRKEYWGLFKCPDYYCGKEVERQMGHGLNQKSCGCIRKNNKSNYKHGDYKSRLYYIFDGIKQRILNPNTKAYKDYGGRGITICPEWAESYVVFRDWALNNGYQDNLEIDRRDNDLGYNPENCRWVTITEQNRNQRKTKLTLEKAEEIRTLYNSGYYTQKDLGEKYNVSQTCISSIIKGNLWKKI